MADIHERELEMELEDEFHEGELEGEDEAGLEGEGWMSAIGNAASSLFGETEDEEEQEGHFELEDEFEDESESWLQTAGNIAGSLFGETEDEYEDEDETEEFSFGGIGKFLKKAAKVAAPLVGSAILGPVGGQLLGKAAGALLGEAELEDEAEDEDEYESESEMVHEIASHPLSQNEAEAEMLAEAAAYTANESEAEAMAGAAFATIISPSDRRALRRILRHMVRGTAGLTRILRRHRRTRPAVRAVPAIMRRAVKDLKRQAAKGAPITRRRAARTVAKHVRRVLGSPKAASVAIKRNVNVCKVAKHRSIGRRPYAAARRRRSTMR